MFDQLVESSPHHDRHAKQALASIIIHSAIIAASIQLTRSVVAAAGSRPTETEVFVAPASIPPARQPSAAVALSATLPRIVPVTEPAISVTVAIGPIAAAPGFDASRLGLPGNPSDMLTGPPRDPDQIASVTEVDDPAVYLDGPGPAYPSPLRHAGIEGSVQLRYVVGVDGRVEPGSIRVIRSSNPAFEPPAINAIAAARFTPARIRGRIVRQLVEQTVKFTLH